MLNTKMFSGLGVNIWTDAMRPRSTDPYPIGFLNSISISASEVWSTLKSTKGDGLVATLFDALYPLHPLRLMAETIPTYTLHLNLLSVLKGTPACISSVRLLRTYSISFYGSTHEHRGEAAGQCW